RNNEPEKALTILEAARKRAPDNALVTASWLAVRAELGLLTLAELEEGARNIRAGRFDAQAVRALEQLVHLVNRAPSAEAARVIDALLQGVRSDLDGSIAPVHRMTFYLQGILHAGQGHADAALTHMLQALELYNSVDAGLRMV